jgi:hypothetical protein
MVRNDRRLNKFSGIRLSFLGNPDMIRWLGTNRSDDKCSRTVQDFEYWRGPDSPKPVNVT